MHIISKSFVNNYLIVMRNKQINKLYKENCIDLFKQAEIYNQDMDTNKILSWI